MRFSRGAFCAFVFLFPVSALVIGADNSNSASKFFGNILAPCAGPNGKAVCDKMKADLKNLREQCKEIDKACPTGTALLQQLYGSETYRPTLPDFIVYFERSADGKYNDLPRGTLIWRGVNTPHIYGARDIYVLAFSEKKLCLEASVAVDFKSEPNPLASLLGSTTKPDDPKAPASDRKVAPLVWYPLSGDSRQDDTYLWLGVERLAIEVNSVDRINVQFGQPKTKDSKDAAAECIDASYNTTYLAANAFISNSPDSRVGLSIALGMTTDPKGTAVATGDSANQYFNGYAFAKYYLRRPELRATPEFEQESRSARRTSYALVLGTNITKSAFNEIILGISAGHLLGNMGVIIGANSLAGVKDSDTGRRWRPFTALEYSF